MRIGLFGGTFDPVHLGHLILAEQSREQASLDQVWFLPAARPPHKLDNELTPFAQRVEMLSLAIACHASFHIETIEKDRPGPSYTIETIRLLQDLHPNQDWHLLIGADTLADLPHWRQPIEILNQVKLLIMARPGSQIDLAGLRSSLGMTDSNWPRHQVIETPLIDIASSDLRHRASLGLSLRYFVPRAVETYILEKKLYK
jgi:nicotinate-nucleotide adenylyltransferase